VAPGLETPAYAHRVSHSDLPMIASILMLAETATGCPCAFSAIMQPQDTCSWTVDEHARLLMITYVSADKGNHVTQALGFSVI